MNVIHNYFCIFNMLHFYWTFLWLILKNPPAMPETQVRPLGQEDPLEKGMATHSGILARRIPWTEEPGGLQSVGLQSWTWLSDQHFHFSFLLLFTLSIYNFHYDISLDFFFNLRNLERCFLLYINIYMYI